MIDHKSRTLLQPPEVASFFVCVAILSLFVALAVFWQQSVAWGELVFRTGAALGIGGLGLLYRKLDRNEGIALVLIGTGLFVGFTNSTIFLNYLFLPVSRPIVDPFLIRVDAFFGYHWKSFVVTLADYPQFGRALAWVYHTSVVQMFGLIVILAFSQNHLQLYRFIVAGMAAGLMTVGIWIVFPSFGPAAYQTIPAGVSEKINLVVTNDYGREILRLADEGSAIISFSHTLGLIALPSFHTVMAALAVWFSRGLIIFYPVLALNILMIPAILSHGGHHLVDVFGGLIISIVALVITLILLPEPGANQVVQAS
ncbi:phosphatase PAP2 family protein [Ruegeria atlantica]|uniref:phosphatase PAP2 family protein n=1 Tax=Ruegeria atlantica TaxID=81569 RepID=UPI00147BCCA9|nr:phosphatase PAP2 family protein [Ruegeria atlantica]